MNIKTKINRLAIISGVKSGMTGFEPKIVIEVGINDKNYAGAKEQAREIAKIIEIKLEHYLEQFPHRIYVEE